MNARGKLRRRAASKCAKRRRASSVPLTLAKFRSTASRRSVSRKGAWSRILASRTTRQSSSGSPIGIHAQFFADSLDLADTFARKLFQLRPVRNEVGMGGAHLGINQV